MLNTYIHIDRHINCKINSFKDELKNSPEHKWRDNNIFMIIAGATESTGLQTFKYYI